MSTTCRPRLFLGTQRTAMVGSQELFWKINKNCGVMKEQCEEWMDIYIDGLAKPKRDMHNRVPTFQNI